MEHSPPFLSHSLTPPLCFSINRLDFFFCLNTEDMRAEQEEEV